MRNSSLNNYLFHETQSSFTMYQEIKHGQKPELYHSSQVPKSPNFPEKKDRNLNSGKRTPLRATKKHHSCLKIGSYDVFCKPHTSLYTLYISIIARPTQTASTNTYQTRLLNILSATAKKQKLGGAKQSSQSGRHGSAITLNN